MFATISLLMWILANAFLFTVFRIHSRVLRILTSVSIGQVFAWSFGTFVYYVESASRRGGPGWDYYVYACQGAALGIVVLTVANSAAARAYGYRLIGSPFWRRGKSADAPTTTAPPAASPPP
jgi:hypothetical protein